MLMDYEAALAGAAVGFGTGFAIEYGRLDPTDTYRMARVLLVVALLIVIVTGNVWEFFLIIVPITVMHMLARWLFGPPPS